MSPRCRYLLATAMLAAVPQSARAQRETFENVSAWFSWFGDVELNHHWSIDYDASARRTGPASEPAQYLWRASLRRNLAPNVRVAAGYAGSDTHPYGKLPIAFRTPEHRVFEQLQLYHAIGRLQFTHRYRLEQRWGGRVTAENGDTAVRNWVRTNRARYLVRATIPLQGPTLDGGEWFANVGNEVMLNFGANINQNVFDQNRSQVSIGRRLGSGARLELGYMEHLVQRASGRQLERNHTIMTTLTTAFHLPGAGK